MFRKMCLIREFEVSVKELWKKNLIYGLAHSYEGAEAIAVGACTALQRGDYITSTHRGHGHTIAKGADTTAMMCELFGRASGCNRGKGGSMHIADFSIGMLGANGVVAAGIPIAVGAAQAIKLRGGGEIVACFFGDGAVNRGPFLEGLNWAAIYRLPVLFVCEDNRYSATTPTAEMTGGDGAAARAAAIGVPARVVDGNDVEAVDAAVQALGDEIRAGGGARLLHAITYRVKGHVSVDAAAYREADEVTRALEQDPLRAAGERLAARGIGERALAQIRTEADAEIARAVAAAHAAAWPEVAEAYRDVQDVGAGRWY